MMFRMQPSRIVNWGINSNDLTQQNTRSLA